MILGMSIVGIGAVSVVVGFAIGIVSGLFGIGGGSVMLPVFRLAFGLSPVGSTATSLFTIIPTSLSGAVTHVRGKTCVPKLGLALGIGGACTSSLGAWLAQISPGWLVMLAAAIVISYSALTMLRKALAAPRSGQLAPTPATAPAPAAPAPAAPAPAPGADALAFDPRALGGGDYAKALAIGALAGVASGYVGLGGGFLMVPLMLAILHLPMKLASGTSLVAMVILATPATITQCVFGNVDFLIGIAVACGSIPGAFVGARLITRVPERALRFGFAAFLGLAAVLLVVKELGLLG